MKLGQHIKIKDNLTVTLFEYSKTKPEHHTPIQTFLSRDGSLKVDELSEINRKICRGIILTSKIRYYNHSSYRINLCTMMLPGKVMVRKCAENYLNRAFKLDSRGVVFHVGKYLKTDPSIALVKMVESLEYLARIAHVECPVLLETPAGQGTELLVGFRAFSDFYKALKAKVGDSVKICIDTCHVFAGGDDPAMYISNWIIEHGVDSIGLVHFNDSKTPKGSCVDRHEPWQSGKGHIGLDTMTLVRNLCHHHGIDMVTE